MIFKNKSGLPVNVAENINAPHFFSTRHGGVSSGVYESLNTSFTVGDDEKNVHENLKRIANALGYDESDIVCSNQTHSTVSRKVTSDDKGTGVFKEKFSEPADAIMTSDEDVLLLVRSADCTPVLLWDKDNTAVAAIHSGWKGTLENIIGATVKSFCESYGVAAKNICAAIGPCISKESFEVGEDVAKMFADKGYGSFIDRDYEKPHIDLVAICKSQLEKEGVANIDVSGECTKINNAKYFSHRAQGIKRGLLCAVIGKGKSTKQI